MSTPYDIGTNLALLHTDMEKDAFLSLLGRGALAVGRALPTIGKAVGAEAMAGARGVGQAFGKGVLPGIKSMATSSLGKEMLIGGGIEGTIGAVQANPGDRMSAFAKGFGRGAVVGGVGAGIGSGLNHAKALPGVQSFLNQRQGVGALGRAGRTALNWATKPMGTSIMGSIAADKLVPGLKPQQPANVNPMSNIPGFY